MFLEKTAQIRIHNSASSEVCMHCNRPPWWWEIKKYKGSWNDPCQNLIQIPYPAQKRLAATEAWYAFTSLYDGRTFKIRVCTCVKPLKLASLSFGEFSLHPLRMHDVSCSAPSAVTIHPNQNIDHRANPHSGSHPDWQCVILTCYPSTAISHKTYVERGSSVVVKLSFHAYATNR